MKNLTKVLAIFTALFCIIVSSSALAAKDTIYTGLFSSVAVSGYDTVAYFSEGHPTKGSKDFEYKWQDSTWRFANAENLELFKNNPEKYAPQYGGYCAYAVAKNKTASSDPTQFHIKDGKLYLNYNAKIQNKWLAERDTFIVDADQNWPSVLE